MAKRGGKRRDPAREQFWRRTIRRQQRSGIAVTEFCRREGLKDGAFRWWRKELARLDLESVLPRPPAPIEIVLPSGPTLRVPTGFDPRTLAAVLSVLEGRPC
jgi:hypothetical protein